MEAAGSISGNAGDKHDWIELGRHKPNQWQVKPWTGSRVSVLSNIPKHPQKRQVVVYGALPRWDPCAHKLSLLISTRIEVIAIN